jgi:3-oxoadipate CoA-transferase, beta subunit
MNNQLPDSSRPLSLDEIAAVVAADIPVGSFVNPGIGHLTNAANHLVPAQQVMLHTENGMLGMGPEAREDQLDPDLINAGKVPVSERPGASSFHQADSFAMMRGGHLDISVLGSCQGSGDLANWHTRGGTYQQWAAQWTERSGPRRRSS